MSSPSPTPAIGLLLAAALAAAPAAPAAAQQRPASLVDSLLARMTLDEKLGQLTMTPAEAGQTGPAAPAGGEQAVREGHIGAFLNLYGAAATRRMQRIAVEESRLRIPLLFAHDVIHGWRTIFPVPLAEAASWDSARVEGAARIAAVEATAHGLHWTFAPMVDVARDPRWGRIVEGAGEDPYLGSVLAAARVRGFQGTDLSLPNTMLASVKHFAAYGGAEGGRDYNVVEATERTLWETYFPPFEAAVRAGAATVMASFNEIGGTPAHASDWLLGDVLRARWRFGGLVVSDWSGIHELVPHGVAVDDAEAARRALRAGVDVDMSDDVYRRTLAAEVRAGRVAEALVDSAVRRVLLAKHALGLFDDPYRYGDTTRERTMTLTAEHRAAARALAREAIVLLENRSPDGGGAPALPLAKTLRSLAVIGPLADAPHDALGSWSAVGRDADAVSVLAGLRAALPDARITHVRGVPVDTARTAGIAAGIAAAVAAARGADAVVLVLGERADMSAEAASRASIELPGAQRALAQAVVRAVRAATPAKPVVAVLMSGRPLAVPWLADSASAVVAAWFLGVEHGHALADVLLGDANPSGKLPVTFPRATGQVPLYYDHRSTGRPSDAANRYTSKYLDLPWTPQWPFGHGLSYTTFAYAGLRVGAAEVRAGDSVVVSVDVTNAGRRAGDEVVQLYLRDDAASVTRPVRALVGFRRVALAPGETRTVRFAVGPAAMALYDARMRRVVEPGAFTLWAGGSSAATLAGRFRVTGDTLVLAPPPSRPR